MRLQRLFTPFVIAAVASLAACGGTDRADASYDEPALETNAPATNLGPEPGVYDEPVAADTWADEEWQESAPLEVDTVAAEPELDGAGTDGYVGDADDLP